MPLGYKNPVLLSATDGVGTKLKIAIESGILDSVGIDLVAMCVNDLICNFGTPLFFLDYYATGKLDPNRAKSVVDGIARGCREAESALIGGETAEMPDMYRGDDFDLAGFAVGIAEKEDLDRTSQIKENQIVVALPSSGIHSNGYSLVRKIFFEKLSMSLEDEFNGKPLVETLLTPTKIYVKDFKRNRDKIKALAHITGGGLIENIPRVLPENFKVEIEKSKIRTLPIFEFLSRYVAEDEMYRTFNMGVGMVLIVDEVDVDIIYNNIEGSYAIGRVIKGRKGVCFA
jgi:phosphoribosylformylglycinamidine cyclo-ligase